MTKADSSLDEAARIKYLRNYDKSALAPDGRPSFNRLIFSGSPYLLQHAENPVDWYPWGEEAFARARSEDKPILLSIGYAACHWCHVMAHESFENNEVAGVINRYFVPIKVDREERPDIDEQYMTAAQLMNQSGGWPLNVILTPARKPFFAATYLPLHSRRGMPGIIDVLERIAGAWDTRRNEIEQHADTVIQSLHDLAKPQAGTLSNGDLLEPAYRQLRSVYDGVRGGFGKQPKFPMPLNLMFLLHYAGRSGSREALTMAAHSLRMMRQGGIYDQLGFGFHRYSVDGEWLIPHFEKMLYDQALLAVTYLQACQLTANPFFLEVAEEIFAYIEEEMLTPDGAFYSALDADSEGKEGLYYLWTKEEIAAIIGAEGAGVFSRLFGLRADSMLEGKYVLSLPVALPEFAQSEGLRPEELASAIKAWREQLLLARAQRIRPLRDEKVITAWNGLMIAALALGYRVTGQDKYRAGAARAIDYIKGKMVAPTGRLRRVVYGEEDSIPGLLEDYAFFIWGLLEMYQSTLHQDYLEDALHYAREMLRLFSDQENGGLYETGADSESVLVRMQGGADGVIPSGNSLAIMNLLKLGRITKDASLLAAGETALLAGTGNLQSQPTNHILLLMAHDFFQGPEVEITVAGTEQTPGRDSLLRAIGGRLIPGLVLRQGAGDPDYPEIAGKAAAYICAGGACRPPASDLPTLERLLDELAPRMPE